MTLSHALGSNWLHFPKYELPPPMVGFCLEHYNRIARLLNHNIPVEVAIEVKTRVEPSANTFNVTAEIKGSDKADEIVMIGAHLDSWTAATGATDNAAGVSVMMEAVRILKALDLKPRRTIRIALWGGHEGEGTGARTYVSDHFGSIENPKPEYKKISAYFNLDNGTGRIRGIYTNQNAQLIPIFKKWFEPFESLGAYAVSINVMTGTDHVRFEEIGLPGFQFIQDPIEYNELTHHTMMDLYDHLKESDLKQASAIIAAFAYTAATREELLPRKLAK
jgi:Zn-dependent M28 family amino/carboxypeptidase